MQQQKTHHQAYRQGGFTLIELMIVVAIIGILAAIAIPQYQSYVARSEAASALATLRGAQVNIEDVLIRGKIPSVDADEAAEDHSYIGLTSEDVSLGDVSIDGFVTEGDDGGVSANGSIILAMTGGSAANATKSLWLTRDDNGAWTCHTDVDEDYAPQGCETGETVPSSSSSP